MSSPGRHKPGPAAAIRALPGTHPVHRQSPPGRSRSTISTDAPSEAAVHAPTKPAVPPLTTSRSHAPPCGATGTAGAAAVVRTVLTRHPTMSADGATEVGHRQQEDRRRRILLRVAELSCA